MKKMNTCILAPQFPSKTVVVITIEVHARDVVRLVDSDLISLRRKEIRFMVSQMMMKPKPC
jgi:hypothetical protein